jgi:hypothetical protein
MTFTPWMNLSEETAMRIIPDHTYQGEWSHRTMLENVPGYTGPITIIHYRDGSYTIQQGAKPIMYQMEATLLSLLLTISMELESGIPASEILGAA